MTIICNVNVMVQLHVGTESLLIQYPHVIQDKHFLNFRRRTWEISISVLFTVIKLGHYLKGFFCWHTNNN